MSRFAMPQPQENEFIAVAKLIADPVAFEGRLRLLQDASARYDIIAKDITDLEQKKIELQNFLIVHNEQIEKDNQLLAKQHLQLEQERSELENLRARIDAKENRLNKMIEVFSGDINLIAGVYRRELHIN